MVMYLLIRKFIYSKSCWSKLWLFVPNHSLIFPPKKLYVRTFWWLSQDFIRIFSGLSQNFFRIFSGTFLVLSQNFFQDFLRTDRLSLFVTGFDLKMTWFVINRIVIKRIWPNLDWIFLKLQWIYPKSYWIWIRHNCCKFVMIFFFKMLTWLCFFFLICINIFLLDLLPWFSSINVKRWFP